MSQKIKKVKQVCECKNCGNEAEMLITCTLEEDDSGHTASATDHEATEPDQRLKGSATCSHCGNEADMWVDIET